MEHVQNLEAQSDKLQWGLALSGGVSSIAALTVTQFIQLQWGLALSGGVT